jgi:hypothetical protein
MFFKCAYRNLKPGGVCHLITFNPSFTFFENRIANRIFHSDGQGNITVDFLNPHTFEIVFQSHLTQFLIGEYTAQAEDAGFKNLAWEIMQPVHEPGLEVGFWDSYTKNQPYTCIKLVK